MRHLLLLSFLLLLAGCVSLPSDPGWGGAPSSPSSTFLSPGSHPGICGRTPEVQVALIRAIAVEGPRMPCGSINSWELYRLRRLQVDADYLLPGDFRDLLGLRELDVTVGNRFPLVTGVFQGMPSLRRMEVTFVRSRGDFTDRTALLEPGVFDDLGALERLEINGRHSQTGLRLDGRNLRGLEGLWELDVDSVSSITPGALSDLQGLRRLRLTAAYTPPSGRPEETPVLPPGLLEPLPALSDVRFRHFR